MLRAIQTQTRCLRATSSKRHIFTTPRHHADPWMLPNTPEHLAATESPSLENPLGKLDPIKRHNESKETLVARLVYQSRKRGTLESDLLLSTFARDQLHILSLEELREYDKVCDRSLTKESRPLTVCDSFWTNLIGISTIGRLANANHPSTGRSPAFSKSSEYMPATRGKLFERCPL